MYKWLIKPFLFLFSPETAHHLAMNALKMSLKVPGVKSIFKPQILNFEPHNLFGLEFPNCLGLAAGFDKNAQYIDELASLGFGFVEIGTVTPKPQSGNPKPRLFRLKQDKAIINRMGFNNDGVDAVVARLKKRKSNIIVGGNIGKNKLTPNEHAVDDYVICFENLFDHVDYFVVNVSSPNTPNLRDLQEKEPLTKLLNTLQQINREKPHPKPILLKIAPDLTNNQLDDIVEIVQVTKIAGVIATNTTIARDNLQTKPNTLKSIGNGGLSGKPLANRSTEVVRYLKTQSNNSFAIIGVGGIHTVKDAKDKLEAGASLVQIYTGFIYEGPDLIKAITNGLYTR